MTGFAALPLAQEEGTDPNSTRKFKGSSRILGPRWANLPTLTIGLLGVQIFWSVEMSYASPYLISLGLSKSSMAIVFVAGPLSGLIMQPLIGILADNSTSRFGRRRPYMILGSILCMVAMLLLGYTRPVASIFTSRGSDANNILTIWLAILAIYLIDFSINAVQAVDRALLVDTLPPSDQASGNAWAARMLGIGSVVGFFVGNIDLTRILPFLGNTQLEVLSVVVSLLLLAGHLIMAIMVKERVLLKTESSGRRSGSNAFIQELKDIWSNIRTLPWVIRQICLVQFFAWIAWFPVLFYSTLYVGDLHKQNSPVPATDEARKLLDAEATRLGSRALFFSSLLALLANVALPAFVPEAKTQERDYEQSLWERLRIPKMFQVHLATLWAASHIIFAGCMLATFFTHTVWGATVLITVTGFSWAITQWAPFSLLAEAILTEPGPASTDDGGSILLEDTRGSRLEAQDGEREGFLSGRRSESEDGEGDDDESDVDVQNAKSARLGVLGSNSDARVSHLNVNGDRHSDDDYAFVGGQRSSRGDEPDQRQRGGGLSAKAGIILGIHNVFIVIPQFLVTGLSSIVFAIFDPKKVVIPHRPVNNGTIPAVSTSLKNATEALFDTILQRSDDFVDLSTREPEASQSSSSIVYIFRFGGITATIAFVLCWRLARALRHR
ncbi:MFS general substrate transporter [Coprinellus micaceus]|uniref:MFS general substrate transporter n=1 Tax=Coprinellus micaceus TaxID=71717 RepID=A0A4Y7SP44_COPMI|nr:MFS general substrate transporter [Coprinellus micaceus]